MSLPLTDLSSLADGIVSVLREPVGWAAIAGAVVRMIGSVLTSRTSARSAENEGKLTAEIETKRIDANLAAITLTSMQSFISELQSDVTELRRELRSEREQLAAANEKVIKAEATVRSALDEIHLLRRQLEESVKLDLELKRSKSNLPPPVD